MDFAFRFLLDVVKLTGPAGEGAEALTKFERAFDKCARAMERMEKAVGGSGGKIQAAVGKIADKLDKLDKPTRATRVQTDLRKIADEWEKLADKAAKAEAKQTAAAERESQKRIRLAEKEAKARAQAEERAYKQSATGRLLGGHRSFGALLGDRAIRKGAGMVSGAADGLLDASGAALGGVGSAGIGAVTMAASAAWDLARAGASGAYSFAQMAIAAQGMREQSVEGFRAVFGSEEIANRLTDKAIQIAKETKFDTKDVVGVFNTFAASGFKEEQLTPFFSAYADVASARGEGKARQMLGGLANLQASPVATWGAFKSAAMGGAGLDESLKALAARMGIDGKGNLKRRVMDMMRHDQISTLDAQNSVLGAVSSRYDQGGPLGKYAKAAGSGTWEGLISNIRNGLGDVLAMKLPEGHSMSKLKGLLASIGGDGGLFDKTTARGQRFEAVMLKYTDSLFKLFDIDPSKTGSFMDTLLDAMERLQPKFDKFIVDTRQKVIGLLDDLFTPGKDQKGFGEKLGESIGEGFSIALAKAMPLLVEAAVKAVPGVVSAAAKGAWSIGSHLGDQAGQSVASTGVPQKIASVFWAPANAATAAADWLGDHLFTESSALQAKNGTSRRGALPSFATGGVVPGAYGEPQLVLAHGGETFHGLGNVPSTSTMSGGGVTLTGPVYIQLDGTGKNGEQLVDELFAALMRRIGQNTRGPSAGSLPGVA